MTGRRYSLVPRNANRFPWWRTAQLILILLGGEAILSPGYAAESPTFKEQQVKAAFIYNFTKFVEWPSERFAGKSAPILVGVFGLPVLCDELQKIVQNRKVNGRDIVVKAVKTPKEAECLHILFISASNTDKSEDVLKAANSVGALTVGESDRFASLDGIINFTMEADKVRFEINISAAERAGLKVSAQLQKLAKTVRKKD
jgi:hypothetical protein